MKKTKVKKDKSKPKPKPKPKQKQKQKQKQIVNIKIGGQGSKQQQEQSRPPVPTIITQQIPINQPQPFSNDLMALFSKVLDKKMEVPAALPKTFANASVGENVPLRSLVDTAQQAVRPIRLYEDNVSDIADLPFMDNIAQENDEVGSYASSTDWVKDLIKQGKSRREQELDEEYEEFLEQQQPPIIPVRPSVNLEEPIPPESFLNYPAIYSDPLRNQQSEINPIRQPTLTSLMGQQEENPAEQFRAVLNLASQEPAEKKPSAIIEEPAEEKPLLLTPKTRDTPKKALLSDINTLLNDAFTPSEIKEVIKRYRNENNIKKPLNNFNRSELDSFKDYLVNVRPPSQLIKAQETISI
jgi:hypothetical protein